MGKRMDLRRILILGAGPIVIGQACEFDYSGSQACKALKSEGYDVILVNSNPATIMTDPQLASQTYIEPLTLPAVEAIIRKERPDALLPTMGGQTALNLAFQLHQSGILQQYGVELIGANFEAIHAAEDREAFKKVVLTCGLDVLQSQTVHTLEEAQSVALTLGFPLIIRPAFTLGGSGGSVVYEKSEFEALVEHGLALSPIHQILIEESALGWKEYEFELMRDRADNVVIVCSVENLDPMGVHTGDSITVAPAQTLTDKEYHQLRDASIKIIRAIGVDAGGCNIQFAIHPHTGRIVVIEMNPRVSRSSALVSKATGVPIAKISAKLAVGLTLDEIANDITQNTPACFEPAIDYVVTKIPRFSFEKFPGANATLSPQMKSVGEVMAIGRTFQESFQKAIRGLEIGLHGWMFPLISLTEQELREKLSRPSSDRMQWIYQALKTGMIVSSPSPLDRVRGGISIEEIYDITGIDPWFLRNLEDILQTERQLGHYCLPAVPLSEEKTLALPHPPVEGEGKVCSPALLRKAKSQGFSDRQIATALAPVLVEDTDEVSFTPGNEVLPWRGVGGDLTEEVFAYRQALGIESVFKSVDTCAGEFEAYTPYFYSTFDGVENEADIPPAKPRIAIIGGGPNRIGQGIEFDYCCVHASQILQSLGYEAIMINSNPETVSTDYDISDRLYFEPLTEEDTLRILRQEQPLGVIVQLGGQTPLKLARAIEKAGFPLLGTSLTSIDGAEDREKFKLILAELGLRCPESGLATSEAQALSIAEKIGFPLIARPSYVLGGRGMRIFYNQSSLSSYLKEVIRIEPDYPVLIERFLEEAIEIDVDAVSDGVDTFVGAILEHIEHAGVHSGDSACVWPAQNLSEEMKTEIVAATAALSQALHVQGLLNIQFAIRQETLYVLEVNPRASRTVPFVCKATGVPLIQAAIRVMLGESLDQVRKELQFQDDDAPKHVAVKVPVFPFNKFKGADPKLGPEMRSTGEVMGIDDTFAMAYAKAQSGAGIQLPTSGKIFISMNNFDKPYAIPLAEKLHELGFELLATPGTAIYFQKHGLPVTIIRKKHEGHPNAEDLIARGEVHLVINTPIGEEALNDDSYIRKAAVLHNIPMVTTLSGALAMAEAIAAIQEEIAPQALSLQERFQNTGKVAPINR